MPRQSLRGRVVLLLAHEPIWELLLEHLRLGDGDVVLLLLLDHHRGELLLAALHLLKLNRIVVVFVEMWIRRLLLNFGGI